MNGRSDRTIAPGAAEEVQFTINTARKQKGVAAKTIKVTTNDAESPNPTLVCEVAVKVPFEVTPNMINFGTIERTAEAQKKTFKVTRGDGGPIKPEIVPFKDENIKATLREITAGEEYELDVELLPPWPNKAVQGYLKLKTGIENLPEDQVRYYARMAERLRAVPNRISVPDDLTSELNTRVRLYWSGGDAGKVLNTTCSDPKIATKYIEENGQQYIDVTIPAGYDAPRTGNFIVVKTDDAQAPDLRIQVVPRTTPKTAAGSSPMKPPVGPGSGNQPILRPRPGLAQPAAPRPADQAGEPKAEVSKPTPGADKPAAADPSKGDES